MKKKEIRMLRNFERAGFQFRKNETFTVNVLKIEITGGFERYPTDTMAGYLDWSVLVEFENGKIMSFYLDYHICIVGDAE